MKYNFLPYLICLQLFSGCNQRPDSTIISGRLGDFESDQLILYKSTERYGFREWLSAVDTTSVEDDGRFRFEFTITEPDFFQIANEAGNTQTLDLYLRPGDSLFVTREKVDDVFRFNYEGAFADAYSYFTQRDSLRQLEPLFKGSPRDIYYFSTDSASEILHNQLQWEEDLIAKSFADNAEWKPFRQYVEDMRQYENAAQYFSYLYYHNYYVNDTFVYLIPDTGYYAFMKDIDLTHAPQGYSWQYQSFLGSYVADQIEHRYKHLSDSAKWGENLSLRFEVIKSDLTGKAKDAALFGLTSEFSHSLENHDFFDVIAQIDTYFVENKTDETYLKKFRRITEDFNVLKKGNPAPDIALPGVAGDTLRLSDLKGKVVYVDFWGTWCYPCLMEMPHSLTLQEKFKDKNVEFVYIGLEGKGEQVDEWKDFVSGKRSFDYAPFLEQRVYPGVHMLSEGQFGNPQVTPYKVSYAPTYMLIDASGNIAQARAPRPSSPEIEEAIEELLGSE